MTFGEYLKYWLEECCKPNQTPNTYESYERNVLKHIVPALGNIHLSKLTPLHLQQFYSRSLQEGRLNGKGGLSNKTVLYFHRIIHSALEQAVKWQLVSKNVSRAVEPPKPKKYKPTTLTDTQVLKLLQVAENTPIYIPVLLGISTGMRRGEVLGLMWKDTDLENGVVRVTQSLAPTKEGLKFIPPKSEKSCRTISLPPSVVNTLEKHKLQQAKNKLRLGDAYQDNNLVCCYPDGKPINPGTFSHQFKNLLEKNELPSIRFHDLRHSHASLLVKQGVQPKIISERLGHITIAITMDIYSHVLQETDKETANQFDEILTQKNKLG
ncbi:MAG: site-specific integrase [Thermoanaerobacteraceae bacterium]|nr:site-specific integrase [Thermoanaerobacteraceae bacterium]